MDWSTLFSGLMQNQQPTAQPAGSQVPNAVGPTSVGGPNGPQPVGILNGANAPQGNQQQLLQQAQKLMQPQAQPQQMQPIQMAKPVGSQGIDPMKLLQAMKQNALMNA
jgi:hypothetical protein